MTSKKWLILFVLTVFAVVLLICAFNIITDPFGVFGDDVFDWWSYDMTNNPRTAKISYLDKYHDNYDSYIVGCSSTSSFPTDKFGEYLDADFYNTIVYGADMLDSEQMIDYIIENYGAENIVLNVYIDNAISYGNESNKYTHCMPAKLDGSSSVGYYLRFMFANVNYGIEKIKHYTDRSYLPESYTVFDAESGAYDKRRRDIEPISDMETYLGSYPIFTDYPGGEYTMPYIDETVASLARIKEKCDSSGVNLIVVTAPVYADYMKVFNTDDVKRFYSAVADVTDFWDFSYSSVSFEPRYFYDGTHFRGVVGQMAAARIFGDDSVYIPADFGYHVTKENAEEYFASYGNAQPLEEDEYTAAVPILMYHHIAEETGGNTMIITPEDFEAQIKTLAENGYTSVTFDELEDYVREGRELPDSPVVITFDDGYMSNYDYAYPILSKYGMKATVFVIGSSVGKSTYRDTDIPIKAHFGAAEISEMVSSGVISVQSHTYDMHRSAELENSVVRDRMIMLDGESEEEYITSLRDDIQKSRSEITKLTGEDTFVLAYPQGYYNDTVSAVVREEGIRVTLSTRDGVQIIIKGMPQSLYAMRRIDANLLSPDELIARISAK